MGIDSVIRNMQHWNEAVKEGAKQALSDSLDEALGWMQDDCPVLSGNLQSSLTKKLSADGKTGAIYTDVPYGPFVELGTYKMAAQPFMYPNWKREIPLFRERMWTAVMLT